MRARPSNSAAPLRLLVKEPSPGLFSWMVTQLPMREHEPEMCIDASDHPYSSYETALTFGTACLQAHKAAALENFFYQPNAAGLTARH